MMPKPNAPPLRLPQPRRDLKPSWRPPPSRQQRLLATCVTKDGQTTITANRPMATFRHTGVGNAAALTDYASATDLQNSAAQHATAAGSAGAYTLALSPAMTAYAAGQHFTFKANHLNTGAATLDVNGVGAKAIQRNLAALVGGEIQTNDIIVVVYDGTQFQLISMVPQLLEYTGRNALINGDFRVAERGTSFTRTTTPANSDDTYLFDRCTLLSDGNDRADISQETSVVPTDGYAAIKFDVETVSGTSEKFGIIQIIEARDAAQFDGKTASLSFKARTTSGQVENLRAHVLAWDSTADAVTSDVVSAWGAEGSNPTFVANWTAENVAANLVLSDAYQTFKVEGISIDTSGMTNLAVFIHVDDTDLVATDVLYITDIQLEIGPVATSFERRPIAEERDLCDRYYQEYRAGASTTMCSGTCISTTEGAMPFHLRNPMRAAPAFSTAAADNWQLVHNGTGAAVENVTALTTLGGVTANVVGLLATVASGLVAGDGVYMRDDAGANGKLKFDAEL